MGIGLNSSLTSTIDFQAQALNLRSERQRLIASNIANADTPGYLARDLDFASALRDATGTTSVSTAPTRLSANRPGHITSTASGSTASTLLYAMPSQTSLDGNSVDMDRERASFADNSLKYEATLRFINSGVRTMLSAITGQ